MQDLKQLCTVQLTASRELCQRHAADAQAAVRQRSELQHALAQEQASEHKLQESLQAYMEQVAALQQEVHQAQGVAAGQSFVVCSSSKHAAGSSKPMHEHTAETAKVSPDEDRVATSDDKLVIQQLQDDHSGEVQRLLKCAEQSRRAGSAVVLRLSAAGEHSALAKAFRAWQVRTLRACAAFFQAEASELVETLSKTSSRAAASRAAYVGRVRAAHQQVCLRSAIAVWRLQAPSTVRCCACDMHTWFASSNIITCTSATHGQ